MQIPQVCVGIKGKSFNCIIKNCSNDEIGITQIPSQIMFKRKEQVNEDQVLWFEADSEIETPSKYLSLNLNINGETYKIPMRIFGEREFFVVFVLSSNVHDEWDPRDMRGSYPNESGLTGVALRRELGLLGPGNRNHAFLHHIGDEEEILKMGEEFRYKPLESILHKQDFPITWLIDQTVAASYKDYFVKWHNDYHDMMGYLPPSYRAHNNINYNTKKTLEETTEFLHQLRADWENAFAADISDKFPIYSRFLGIDQWIGSVGSNWINAAEELGLEGIWGIGWDHKSCDTSMFHRGAPWNAYKPSKNQYRIIKPSTEKRKIWAFQWTIRDLVNTLSISPYGSVCFSTDLDDIRTKNILYLERSPTYFWKLMMDYRKAMVQQDFGHFIFLIHQEDHDAHFKDNNEFMELFASELKGSIDNGEKITVATLEEVTAWLNVKYSPEENNWQYIEVHDPLSVSTRSEIQDEFFHSIALIYDPDEEEEIQALLEEKFPADRNLPLVAANFDEDGLWLTQYPMHLPTQFYDYKDQQNIERKEDDELIMCEIPEVSDLSENFSEKGYNLHFNASKALKRAPWTIWLESYDQRPYGWKEDSIWKKGSESIVFCIDIKEGKNEYLL